MAAARPYRRRLVTIVAGIAVLLAACAVVIYAAGSRLAASYLESTLSTPPQRQVRIGALDIHGLSQLRFKDITVADAAGVWLSIPSLEVTWSPRRLTDRVLSVQSVEAAKVTVSRWPAGGGAPPSSPLYLGWPELPLALRLERLEVAALALPTADGRDIPPLSLSSHGALDQGSLLLTLDAASKAGDEAILHLEAHRQAKTLRLNLKVVSDNDGVLTAALQSAGLAGATGADVSLAGDGSWQAWRGDLQASLAGIGQLAGVVAIDNGDRVTLHGGLNVQALQLPRSFVDLIGDEAKIAAALTLDSKGAPRSVTAVLKSPSLALHLTSDAGSQWQSMDISAQSGALSFPGAGKIEFSKLAVSGTVAWAEPGRTTAALDLEAAGFNSAVGSMAKFKGGVKLGFDPGDGTLDIEIKGLSHDVMTSVLPPQATVAWSARGQWDGARLLTVETLSLAAPPLSLLATATVDLDSGQTSAEGQLLAADIFTLSQGWRSGTQNLDLKLIAGDKTYLTFTGRGDPGREGKGRLDRLGPVTINGVLDISSDTKATLTLNTPALSLNGNYSTGGGSSAGQVAVVATDGKRTGKLLGIDLADGSRMDINYRAPARQAKEVLIRLKAPWLGKEDGGLHQVAATLRLLDPLQKPSGGVIFNAATPVGPLRLVSGVSGSDSNIMLDDIFADSPVATVLGNLNIDRRSGIVSGHITGSSGDALALRREFDVDAGGEVRLDLTFAPVNSGGGVVQAIDGALAGHALTLVLDGGEILSLEKLMMEGHAEVDPFAPRGARFRGARGTATVRDFRTSILRLDEADIVFEPPNEGVFPWRGSLKGDYYGDLDLAFDGDFAVTETARLRLATAAGLVGGRPLSLIAPTALSWGEDGWRLDPTTLGVGDGKASLAIGVDSREGSMEATLDGADLKILTLLAGRQPLAGSLSGAASLKVGNSQASGALNLIARGVTEASNDGLSPRFDVTVNGDLKGKDAILPATLRATVTGAGISADAMLQLPVTVRQNGRPHLLVDKSAAISGDISWQGPLGPLVLLTSLSEDTFDGMLKAKAAVSGSLDAPLFDGGLSITGGRYENLRWGAGLRDVEAQATLQGQSIHISKFHGRDVNGGTASASGILSFNGLRQLTGHVEAVLDKARIVRVGTLTAVASGTLNYNRTVDDAVLAGKLKVDQADISMSNKLPPEIPELEVREIHGPTTVAVVADGATALPTFRRFDLEIAAPRRVWVRGRGLDSEWSGQLYVRGDAINPSVEGTLDTVHGTFDFAGKTFTLTNGNLRFTGGRTIDPAISLKAEYTTFDLRAILSLEGTLSKPRVSLSSSPPLPQDEVMARILFGAGVQSLTPMEAVQLASALSSLSSGGGWDVFAIARNALSLDRLSVGASGDRSAGAQVTGGKYLTDRVYLEVRTDTETGASDATLRVDVTRHLQVESDVGSQQGNRIGLRWKKDY